MYSFWNDRDGRGLPRNQKYFGYFYKTEEDAKNADPIPTVILLGEDTSEFADKGSEENPAVGTYQFVYRPARMETSKDGKRKSNYRDLYYVDGDIFGPGDPWTWSDPAKPDEGGNTSYKWEDLNFSQFADKREYWQLFPGFSDEILFEFGDGKGEGMKKAFKGIEPITSLILMNRYANYLETESVEQKEKWSKDKHAVVKFIRDIKLVSIKGITVALSSGVVMFHFI